MGLTVLELPGYEADDIQGTVSAWVEDLPDGHAYILSGDRDLFQLIDDRTTVLYAGQETKAFDRAAFREKYPGIEPEQFVDLKALMGDASDNIPGVAGVGEKTALKLIAAYGSIDGVYAHIEDKEIANGVREKLKTAAITPTFPLPWRGYCGRHPCPSNSRTSPIAGYRATGSSACSPTWN